MWSQTLNFGGGAASTQQRSTAADELFSSSSQEDEMWSSLAQPPPPPAASELFDEVPLEGNHHGGVEQEQQPPEVSADVLFESPEVSQTMDAAALFGGGPEEAPLFGSGGNVDDAGGEDGPEEAGVPFFDDNRPEDSFSWRGRSDAEPEASHETEAAPEQTRASDDEDVREEAKTEEVFQVPSTQVGGAVSCVATTGYVATGICFLDHMLDQLKSHGQLEVGAIVSIRGVECQHGVEYAPTRSKRPHDTSIFAAVGKTVGVAVRKSLVGIETTTRTTFLAPLDEALVRVGVRLLASSAEESSCRCELAPYGETPRGGRLWIGRYRTSLTPTFFKALAQGLGAELDLVKLRGKNAHHIVEATFKSFARALRQNVDLATEPETKTSSQVRGASRSRETKETKIDVRVDLAAEDDLASALRGSPMPQSSAVRVDTGVACYDRLLRTMAEAAGMSLSISCVGDTYIDDHHSVEDVAITLGQCIDEALSSRSGCNRMATASCDDVEVVVDLSNRPHLDWHLPFYGEFLGEQEEMASEMIEHVFSSLASAARLTLHVHRIVPHQNGRHRRPDLDVATSAAHAFGLALRRAMVLDPRRCGKVASSKGTLDK